MDKPLAKILVVDDDDEIRSLLQVVLTREGFDVQPAKDAAAARKVLGTHNGIDLIILDIMMPGEDGLSFCQGLRETQDTPILMVSARSLSIDRSIGLEMGADDYLPKPFDPAELVARIRAILRRSAPHLPAAMAIGDLELDGGTRTVRRSGEPVDLTTVEFDLLAALMRAAGSTVSREDLVRSVLGRDFSPFDRSIDTHVCNLRRKLGPLDGGGERIKGVRGAGYLYASPARPGAR